MFLLQSFQSFSVSPESTDKPVTISSLLSFNHVEKSVSKLKEKLEDFCREEIELISGRGNVSYHTDETIKYSMEEIMYHINDIFMSTVTYSEIIPLKEPKTSPEFLQCKTLLNTLKLLHDLHFEKTMRHYTLN